MKKTLAIIIAALGCATANAQEINAVVTRQGTTNKNCHQLSSLPSVVFGEGNTITVKEGETAKEQYTLSGSNTLTVLFGSAINNEVNAESLEVSYPIYILDSGKLTVSGTMSNDDAQDLVIEDGGQLAFNNGTVTATMKKNISGTDWYTISSPLAANTAFANVTNLIPGNGVSNTSYDLYYLNEKDGVWVNARPETGQISDFTTIDKGVGYLYANATGIGHIAFADKVNVADVTRELTTGAAHGFNLIGNPFTQNIKLGNVTGVTLADGFYVLSNEGNWGSKLTGSDIKPLQGFLVQATTAGTATISKYAASKGERSEQNTNIEMIVSNSNHRDNAYAVFGEGIGLNKVNHRNAEAPMLYIPQDGEDFAISFMDENTTVFPLNFKAMTTGNYSISLKPTDNVNYLILIDNMTGEETNMLLEDSYSFIGSPADYASRFTVKLGVSNGNDDDEQFVYQYGDELIIDGEGMLQVIDVLGRVVISEEVHGQRVNVGGLTIGAYIVRMTGNEVKTQKIIVK